MFSDIERFQQHIPDMPPKTLDDLSTDLRIYTDSKVEIWYTPMPMERKEPKLWILGITPGWNQMRIAYERAAAALGQGLTPAQAIDEPKPSVAFAGSMRKNLVAMLDELNMPTVLDTTTVGNLFGTPALKTGSMLRYPVFTNGSNYNGHTPKPLRHPALLNMLEQTFTQELNNTGNCLILPLGRAVEDMLDHAVKRKTLSGDRIVRGFPHPSGANGHRLRQFAEQKSSLRRQIAAWFDAEC